MQFKCTMHSCCIFLHSSLFIKNDLIIWLQPFDKNVVKFIVPIFIVIICSWGFSLLQSILYCRGYIIMLLGCNYVLNNVHKISARLLSLSYIVSILDLQTYESIVSLHLMYFLNKFYVPMLLIFVTFLLQNYGKD